MNKSCQSSQHVIIMTTLILCLILVSWKLYERLFKEGYTPIDFVASFSKIPQSLASVENKHTTFVTAYYTIPNKYGDGKKNVYIDWITNFIGFSSRIPLVIFSSGKDLKDLQKITKGSPNIRFVDVPMEQFYTYPYLSEFMKQKNIDPERDIHSVELYMIWNEKVSFIQRAMNLNPFNSSHYCWIDIGVVRDSRLSSVMINFPEQSGLDYFYQLNKICFIGIEADNLKKFKDTDEYGISKVNRKPHKLVAVAGGFIFGSKEQFNVYIPRYYKLFNEYINQGVFVGKEQNLMANLIANHNDEFIILDASKIKTWLNLFQKDIWFYMINLFSGLDQTRREHVPLLTGGLGNQLFQVASVYGIARKRGIMVLNPKTSGRNSHSDRNYFKTIFRRFLQREDAFDNFVSKFKMNTYREIESHFYDSNLLSKNSKYSRYSGYFQNYNYFDSYLDELRKLIDLPVLPETRRFFIHIRLGDYVNNKDHYVDLKHYYQTCLEIIRRQYGENVEFCVFTNQKTYAEKYLLDHLPSIRNYTFGDSDELIALAEMSQCALGGICANSTFSWWGAMLNPRKNKKIFFPNRNYPETSRYKNYDIKGLFHPDFMIIETD